MADLVGKTVVVTGATSGIGEATAIAIARQGARVLVVGRDRARGEAVVEAVARAGATGEFVSANLLSLDEIARLGAELAARAPSLDVLINNAGGVFRKRMTSADRVEATFALNAVAPFALTHHLHGTLARANGRVINVATGFLGRTRLKVHELVDPPSYSPYGVYGRAKLASIMVTLEQAERWRQDGISAVAVQPGIVMSTRFGGREPSSPSRWRDLAAVIMQRLGVGATLDQAVDGYLLAASPETASGTYLAWGKAARPPRQAQEAGVRNAVWQLLQRLAGV